MQEKQNQSEPIKINYEKLNKEWDTMSDVSNRSNDNLMRLQESFLVGNYYDYAESIDSSKNDNYYSTSNPLMTGNLSIHDYSHGDNFYPFSRIDTSNTNLSNSYDSDIERHNAFLANIHEKRRIREEKRQKQIEDAQIAIDEIKARSEKASLEYNEKK